MVWYKAIHVSLSCSSCRVRGLGWAIRDAAERIPTRWLPIEKRIEDMFIVDRCRNPEFGSDVVVDPAWLAGV